MPSQPAGLALLHRASSIFAPLPQTILISTSGCDSNDWGRLQGFDEHLVAAGREKAAGMPVEQTAEVTPPMQIVQISPIKVSAPPQLQQTYCVMVDCTS